jgi:hypothetical protein
VPEHDGAVPCFPSRFQARHDLPDFGVEGIFVQPSIRDHWMQCAADLALRPVIHDDLRSAHDQARVERHHPAIGHHQGARLHRIVWDQHFRLREAGGFDHDIGPVDRFGGA